MKIGGTRFQVKNGQHILAWTTAVYAICAVALGYFWYKNSLEEEEVETESRRARADSHPRS